jgi:hypothetical protein
VTALEALKAGAAALLGAEGRHDLAALVRAAELEVAGVETWSLGGRAVTAHRLALVVDAAPLLALARDPGANDAVQSAFERAARTPETALADLVAVLRLPGTGGGWARAYREAPAAPRDERPAPEQVLAGAAALLRAMGAREAAVMLERAVGEHAVVGQVSDMPLVRFVVRLTPEDLAAATRDDALGTKLRGAVAAAATRAAERVAPVELAVRLPGNR